MYFRKNLSIHMKTRLDYIVEQIQIKNPLHSKRIQKNLKKFDQEYFTRADDFLVKYENLLSKDNKDFDYAIDCYITMLADFNYESIRFLETGEYTSKSFAEVNERVYNNPAVMEYYMHGLLMSQFLWKQHYDLLLWFHQIIGKNSNGIENNFIN